jgi:hypothetical protein
MIDWILHRSRFTRLLVSAAMAAMVVLSLALVAAPVSIVQAGPVGDLAGFEDDDGNLAVNSTFDWNGFAPTTWTGTAPFRQTADQVTAGWTFKGLEDAGDSGTDTAYAGGTKQDDNCASVITQKPPNKDDLERIYVGAKVDSLGRTFLVLAWARITQNTTSPSAHVGFEFNQGSVGCPGAPANAQTVQRTAGDVLIVYDFEGGSGDLPVLTLRRWVTSGACEVGSSTAPCWGPAQNLTAGGFAEGRVNTSAVGPVLDTIAPSPETLGLNEFGEAGINLTGAGVIPQNACVSFGKVSAVSRTSGNSGTAQMKDLVGPGNFSLQNCGSVTVIKQTNPRGLNQAFDFTSTLAGSQMVCTADATPASFTLNDTGNAGKTLGSTDAAQNSAGNTETCINVPAGSYTVSESATDPTGFAFASLTCTTTGTGTSATPSGRTANITIAGGGAVICLYVNNQQLGAIQVTKLRKHAADGPGDHPHPLVTFTVNGASKQTDANGIACFDGLTFGSYTVTETVPAGYVLDDPNGRSVTVDNNAKCSDSLYVGETISFHNTPLTDVTISINSQVDGGTASTVTCTNTPLPSLSITTGANGDGTGTATGLRPQTFTCTILIDP